MSVKAGKALAAAAVSGGDPDGYTLGITIFINEDGDPGVYENGLRQNVLFLYRLFEKAPGCKRIFLLNHGVGELAPDKDIPGVPREAVVRTPTVIDELDVVITLGATMDQDSALTLRARGCLMIKYKGGNGGVISMEAVVSVPMRADAERYFDYAYYDEIWLTSQHIHTYKGWCETVYRCPVIEIPQIWEPLLLSSARDEIRDRFGYKPAEKWRVGVMDPNITVMKTSHIPMLVCEAAYRLRPDMFAAAYITNTFQFKTQSHFSSFAGSLSITQAGVLTSEQRYVGIEFLTNHADAIVTHHWENGLNYLYYEVLSGGYPLIHNSEFLRDYGYFYDSFDPEAGGLALIRAFETHDERLDDYKRNNDQLFAEISPTSERSLRIHAGRVTELLRRRRTAALAAPVKR